MAKRISTIIIDDEDLARSRIMNLLSEIDELEIIGQCSSGNAAVKLINEKNPQLIFLDIHLDDINGFEVLNQIQPDRMPQVIFTTASEHYALKAFDHFAFDYLLKPFKDERFYLTTRKLIEVIKTDQSKDFNENIDKLIDFIEKPTESPIGFKKNMLPIKSRGKISFITKSDIKYIIASGYYIEIYTNSKKHLIRESLSSLIKVLDTSNFSRIHRSTIINISYIQEIIYSNYGEIDVRMNDEKLFRISKTYKKEFQDITGI